MVNKNFAGGAAHPLIFPKGAAAPPHPGSQAHASGESSGGPGVGAHRARDFFFFRIPVKFVWLGASTLPPPCAPSPFTEILGSAPVYD